MSKEDTEKRGYELAVLLGDEESGREVLKLLGQHQIDVQETGPLKKINLSYPVSHVQHAYFVFFYLLSTPAEIKLLEQDFRNNKMILRSLIIALPRDRVDLRGVAEKRRLEPTKRPAGPSYEFQPLPPRKVTLSNEAIEKKIEEILQ